MAEAIYDALGPVLTGWTIGGDPAPAPPEWRSAVGDEPGEADLRLLALSAQFLGVAVTAAPAGDLRSLPDLPRLALPTLPEAQRPLVRRILNSMRETCERDDLLRFLAARGWVVHPADWLPSPDRKDAPEVYAPWCEWASLSANRGAADRLSEDLLAAETWQTFTPAERKAALETRRRRDPDGARELLEEKFATENSRVRLGLLAQVAVGLSDTDRSFLESVSATDPAAKVRACAAAFLARLGHGSAIHPNAAELRNFVELRRRGMLEPVQVVVPRSPATHFARDRRAKLFETVDLTSFASALETTPDELATMWSWGEDREADREFAQMAALYGSDQIVARIGERLEGTGLHSLPVLMALSPRLDDGRRSDLARQLLHRGAAFQHVLAFSGGGQRIDDAMDAPAGRMLLRALKKAGDGHRTVDEGSTLRSLGMLVSRTGAAQALERLTAARLNEADPRLDMLRLNAALEDRG